MCRQMGDRPMVSLADTRRNSAPILHRHVPASSCHSQVYKRYGQTFSGSPLPTASRVWLPPPSDRLPMTRLLFTSSPFWDRVPLTVLGIVSFFLWSHSRRCPPRHLRNAFSSVLRIGRPHPMFFLPIAPMSPEETQVASEKTKKSGSSGKKAKADKNGAAKADSSHWIKARNPERT